MFYLEVHFLNKFRHSSGRRIIKEHQQFDFQVAWEPSTVALGLNKIPSSCRWSQFTGMHYNIANAGAGNNKASANTCIGQEGIGCKLSKFLLIEFYGTQETVLSPLQSGYRVQLKCQHLVRQVVCPWQLTAALWAGKLGTSLSTSVTPTQYETSNSKGTGRMSMYTINDRKCFLDYSSIVSWEVVRESE